MSLKSVLHSVSSVLIEDEKTPGVETPIPSIPPISTIPSVFPPSLGVAPSLPVINADMVEAIRKACCESPHTAYVDFIAAEEKLKTSVPDDRQRFQAALAFSGDARTILAAVDTHLAAIQRETDKFSASCENEIHAQLGTINTQTEAKKRDNAGIAEQTKALQEQITQLTATSQTNDAAIAKLNQDAVDTQARVTSTKTTFAVAADSLRHIILGHQRILQSLVK